MIVYTIGGPDPQVHIDHEQGGFKLNRQKVEDFEGFITRYTWYLGKWDGKRIVEAPWSNTDRGDYRPRIKLELKIDGEDHYLDVPTTSTKMLRSYIERLEALGHNLATVKTKFVTKTITSSSGVFSLIFVKLVGNLPQPAPGQVEPAATQSDNQSHK